MKFNFTGFARSFVDAFATHPSEVLNDVGPPHTPSAVPGPPTIGTATRSASQSVQVTFTAPSSNGGSAITGYTVTSNPGGITASGASSPLTVTGLTNGTEYTFSVHATNANGNGQESAASNVAIPATVPSAPAAPVASPGDGQVSLSFSAPANGGSAIIDYTATSSPGGIQVTRTAEFLQSNPLVVTGLNNSQAYTFTITARNQYGSSAASAASNSATPTSPSTVPGAPTIGTASRTASQTCQVTFTAPASNGGVAITSYRATSSPGGITAEAASSPISIPGLVNGTPYTFTVVAINANGAGPASAASNAATPATLPSTMAAPTGVAGNTQATISFTAPDNGGSAITGYTVTASPGGATASGASSPLTVTGLTNDIAYTFTVTATNAYGTSSASPASASVTPFASAPGTGPFNSLYTAGWTPVTGTTVHTKNVQSQPAKSTGISNVSYTDADYGTKIFRVASLTDSPGNGTAKMRHEYARRCPFNCDSTKFILQNSNGFFFVYDAETFERLPGGVTTTDQKQHAVGTNSIHPKDPRDWTWHPTDPNKIIFLPQTDGLTFYEFDVETHVLTTKFSLVGRLAAHGMGSATTVKSSEGRCSDNARYWGWQVFNGSATLGYLTYDMETDTITGALVTSTSSNNVTMSPSGAYIIPSASSGGLTFEQCAAQPLGTLRGTRAYTRDFSSFKQVHVAVTHADVGYDYLGREVYISLNPGSSSWSAIAQNSLFYIPLSGAEGPTQLIALAPAMSQWNSHYSGCCAPGRRGWCVFSAYDSTNRSGFPRYLDNNIALVELKPNPTVYRLADHRTTRLTYWQEPHATISRDGLRIMFSCSWDNTSSSAAALSYMIGLPSWIYGDDGDPPPEPGEPLLTLDMASSTGWSLGTSCTIASGKLHCNNTAGNSTSSYATTVLPPGVYTMEYDISDFNSGNCTVRVNSSGTIVSGTTRLFGTHPAGHYEDTITITGTSTAVEVRATRTGSAMDFKVDNIVFTPQS